MEEQILFRTASKPCKGESVGLPKDHGRAAIERSDIRRRHTRPERQQ